MTERAKAAGRTIQWVAAWLLLPAGLTGMCATMYTNAYIIAWLMLRISEARTSGASQE
jgi:hypothetical protein